VIETGVPQMVLVPLTATLLLILACWMYYTVRDALRHVPTSHTRLFRCTECRRVYADGRHVPLARCPRCGTLNAAVKR
jgi:hypothetical protein